VPDAWLAHTSPLSWGHISFFGDFLWERAAATADKRRPLNLGQTQVAARPATFSVRSAVALFKITTDAMPSTGQFQQRESRKFQR